MVDIQNFYDSESPGENVTLTDYDNPAIKAKITPTNDLTTADGLSSGVGPIVLTVGTSAVRAKVGASPVDNQKSLIITARHDMFWGFTSSVTTSTGFPLFKNQTIIFAIEPKTPTVFEIWLVASTSNREAVVGESI
jgi:hypothetical protein